MAEGTPVRRRRGAALERALLDAAWAEISERGYEALTYDGVAARAGTSKPVLYRRWPSKPELARAAFRHVVGWDPLAVPDTGSLRGDVIALLRQINERRVGIATALVARPGDLHRPTDTGIEDLRASLTTGQDAAMEQIAGRAVRRGEIDPAKLTERILRLPADLFQHQLLMTARAVPDADILEIVDTVFIPAVTGPVPAPGRGNLPVAAGTGRLRADAQRNREQIVAAARVLFAESGSAVPMEEIARRAGVGIGTLYRRFPDRASLVRAVTMESVTVLLAEAHAARTADGTAWDALARLVHRSVELGFSVLLTMLSDQARRGLVADARFRRLRTEFIDAVEALVTRAQREGTMRPDVGAGDVFALVALLLRKVGGGSADLTDVLVRRCVALVLDGLRTGPHGALPGHAISTLALSS